MKDEKKNILVSIRCLVYNHAPYLRKCLDGFVMQKTDFRFEAIVHDDASTDESAKIIKEYSQKYPNIIKPIFETENQYSKRDGVLRDIMNKYMNGVYVAFCEGDDYWIDPYKLQKQVDFLEKNEKISLVYSRAYVKEGNNIRGDISNSAHDFKTLISDNGIPTATVLLRRKDFFDYIEELNPFLKKWMMGDYPLALYFSVKNRIGFLDEFTAVRRRVSGSASNSKNLKYMIKFSDNVTEIRYFFLNNYYKGNDIEALKNDVIMRDLLYKFDLKLKLGGDYKEIVYHYRRIKQEYSFGIRLKLNIILMNRYTLSLYRKFENR